MTFELIYAILCTLFVGGIFTDGWAHNHVADLETFFTPWHAVLYGGYLLAGGWLLFNLVKKNRLAGAAWRKSLPEGYGLSFIGACVFFLSGNGDLLWHTFFGIEQNVDALFSPTHLGLAFGAVLMVGGGFRAAWARAGAGPKGLVPALVSLLLALSVIAFITQYAHPVRTEFLTGSVPASERTQNDHKSLGASAILIQTAVLMGGVLLAARRWKLPPGAMTAMFGVNMLGMAFMTDQYVLVFGALLGGLTADFLLSRIDGPLKRPRDIRTFGLVVPFVSTSAYFLILRATQGIWWTVHVWTGTIVESAVVGYLIAYLMTAFPEKAAPPALIQPEGDVAAS